VYHFSRAIYREISPHISSCQAVDGLSSHARVLQACEQAIERLATDRHYFARPARTLFNDVRIFFPVAAQERVYRTIDGYLTFATECLDRLPKQGFDINGKPLQCRATTRKGTPCQRVPLARNGYCPSHQHLAETENVTTLAA
jgi:hypothetical protein